MADRLIKVDCQIQVPQNSIGVQRHKNRHFVVIVTRGKIMFIALRHLQSKVSKLISGYKNCTNSNREIILSFI